HYRWPHPPSMAAGDLECDLTTEVEQLHREPGATSRQTAKPLAKYVDCRVVLPVVKTGMRIPAIRPKDPFRSTPLLGMFRCGRRAERSTFQLAVCSHSIEGCLMTSRLLKRAFALTVAWPGRHLVAPAMTKQGDRHGGRRASREAATKNRVARRHYSQSVSTAASSTRRSSCA